MLSTTVNSVFEPAELRSCNDADDDDDAFRLRLVVH